MAERRSRRPGDGRPGREASEAQSALHLRLVLALGVAIVLLVVAITAAYFDAEPEWLVPVVVVLAVVGLVDAAVVLVRLRRSPRR